MGQRQKTCPKSLGKKLRTQVLYRDFYTCQHPECSHRDLTGESLEIHHHDHNKNNNFLSNLVTLCVACNQKEAGAYTRAANRLQKIQERIAYWKERQKTLNFG